MVKRRYLFSCVLAVAVVIVGLVGFNIFGDSELSPVTDKVEPEMKIQSIEFDPQIVIRNQTYGEEEFKGIQIMPTNDFKVSAIIQNMTEQTVNNIPVKLTLSSLEDKTRQISKEGIIPTLEPGATAKISFENIQALGDAKGESVTNGQHEMILAIKANAEGGMLQNSEARIVFNVDSSVK